MLDGRGISIDGGPEGRDNQEGWKEGGHLEQPARTEIEKEADDHIALGLLLRKERDERKKSAVQKVLASELAVPQKIEKIREIDEKEDALALLHIVRQVGMQSSRGRVSRMSRAVKLPLQRLSYFAFLFKELARVREFGRRSHVLEARLLPPGIRMDPHLTAFLVKEVQPSAAELSHLLAPVIEHGWLSLTPRQYNLLVLLKRLTDRLQAFDFLRLNWGDLDLIDRLRRIESLFLMLHYVPETLETIVAALRSFLEKQHVEEEEIVRSGGLVLEILSEDFALPSLYNVFLGLNVTRYRRMLTLSDLMREGLGEMVDSQRFDCENEIRARMEEYIEESLQSMKKVHEQLSEARRINSFITFDEQGKPDSTILRKLYQAAYPREPVDFDRDSGNIVLFVSRLVRAFDVVFSPLLNGRPILEDGERAELFSRSFFEVDFTRLRTVVEKLERGPFHFSNFPLSRYLQIKGARLGTVGNEMEGSQLILEGVGSLVDIGKTLAKVLGTRAPAGAANGSPEPLQPVVLQGKSFAIPSENRRLRGHSLINGKTVAEALSLAVAISFTAGLLFQDDFLSLFTGKEKRLAADLQTRLKLMENLLDPENYRELSALYS